MGWFENQIEERREADRQLLEDSFLRISGVVLGKRTAERFSDDRIITKNAIDEILKYYHYKPTDLPDNVKNAEEQLDYCLRPHGVMRRSVELTKGWYKDAFGPMLAFMKEDGTPVALLPGKLRGYFFTDPRTGKREKISSKNVNLFDTDALCFYRPLPLKKIGIKDLLIYMKRCISASDIVLILLSSLAVVLIGMLMPRLTKLLTGPVLRSGRQDALLGMAICMLCITFSTKLIDGINGIVEKRVEIKTSLGVQASVMMRLVSLPASFFEDYSPGELKSRAMSVNQLCMLLIGIVMSAGLSSLTSLLYVTQIFSFAPALVIPSVLIIIVTVAISATTTIVQIGLNKRQLELTAKESGMSYAMITGVQKVRLAGAEKRIFARWMDIYTQEAELNYNPPMFIKINGVITTAITLISNIVLYYMAIESGVDQSSYFAFTAAYGIVMGAFLNLAGTALSTAQIKPILDMAQPFLKTEPETSDGKEFVTSIRGGVEMDHVSFRYSEDTPYVLDDMSLKIKPGEYVAIVGKTGCGKSTLMRLLLGFEKPEKGAIYYDGKDMNTLDPSSLRKKIGTVMQTSGLFQGDIYSNIVISAPQLSLNDAWEAAEKAGIADDIREMPMGMHTVISEGQGGISGGQKQRLMIARAIAPRPKLLMFDEATSALDNKTQKKVSEALDGMGCTRLIIAHRLSTIKHCDRILVLDGGKIIESGTYEELIDLNGYFAELVKRQRPDIAAN